MATDSDHMGFVSKDDLEKNDQIVQKFSESIQEGGATINGKFSRLRNLVSESAEARGIVPVPLEERTDKKGTTLFSLWFTANCSLLPIATGMSGTLIYGLSLRDASLVILFFTLLCTAPVAWMGMMGPKTGLRQMIQTRYYFGKYLVIVVVLLQLATLTGYTIITAIISGQTLAAISDGHLSLTVGIIITALFGLTVSFMGYKVLHLYEQYSWIPTMVAIIIAVGVGGKHLFSQAATTAPTARAVLSFGSICASFSISWAALVSDFSVYISPEVPRYRIFTYVYTGYCIPSISLLVLGAAIGASIPTIPAWATANTAYSTGGVMYALVSSIGGFGKFVAVLLAFSVIGNTACSLYSLSISLQTLLPILTRVPRYCFSILITAIVIPVAIVAANNFYASLGNFLGIIGYWTAAYVGIALTEHHYFRRGSYESYNPAIWDIRDKLPVGVAALAAGALSFALIIPSMDAAWYVGPIAMHTGDLGIEVGICLSVLFYIPLRTLEVRFFGR